MTIAATALKEKIRRKELYIITAIGLLILLLFGTGTGTITMDGKPITDYDNLAPVFITVINVIGGAMAIVLSLHTIPNEYDRKTSHLIWIRGIRQPRFHGELALASGISSMISEAILYMGSLVFMIMKGKMGEAWRLIPAFLIVAVSIWMICLFTSILSILLPGMLAGILATACYLAGILHGILDVLSGAISGVGSVLLKGILLVVPDLNEIQVQAGNVIKGSTVDAHVIWKGMLILYILCLLFFVCKRKEA